ncbi:cellulase family glycosylhydrolase [Winogradskyella sp.]|nr:cellulase family glycosylhydrolase [Winogradskyella sp.]MDB9755605.1 cellulase family glycosylhydrolase [Winogradskyella sp.]MDB9782739.1 cellulase family glycosylhydrolase [Winogradskyella sp.]MDC0009317.1 cellulase family glycosylhydrolase [Winogradskyella sp.]MDC1504638.1 cellulase family glycosylhydrolase [Winogradskyella sp.]
MTRILLPIFIFLLTGFKSFAQTSPEVMVDRMGRGINVGNVLSAPFEGNWAPVLVESYIQDIAVVGFKNVRVPIRFDNQTTSLDAVNYENNLGNYIGSPSDYQVNSTYLDRIEEVTNWIVDNEMVAIIDVHGDHWFWESYDSESAEYKTGNDRLAAEDRFRAIWRDISERFQNKSENILFEIMNEAYFSMSAPEVNYINSEILSIIRVTNPTRNVIVNGGGVNSWEAPLQIPSSFINGDDYLIATFHYYRPFSFTSSSRPEFNDNDWGTTSDKATVDSEFDAVLSWSQFNDIPIFFGEFGADNTCGFDYEDGICGTDGGPDNASRVEYHRYLAEAAVSRGFSFAAWDAGHKSNKTIYNVSDRSWVVDVRNALLGVDCLTSGIIKNADIECGFNTDWDLFVQSPAIANYFNADALNSRSDSNTMQVDVTSTDGSSFNRVILRNDIIEDLSAINNTLNFSCFAKASTNDQQFRIRLRAVVNGVVELSASPNLNLSDSEFEQFDFQYQIPENASSLQFQVLCGNQPGVYYFDDFSVEEETLSLADFQNYSKSVLYPNPTNTILNFKTTKQISLVELYNLNGQQFKIGHSNNQIDVSNYANGLYFVRLIYNEGDISNHKILINHNN